LSILGYEARSNASRVYLTLRQRIIQCEVAPNQKLKIAELAAELEVSPGAVREALSRLSTEQLAIASDQRGFSVAPITLSELKDITDARVDIENLALRRSIAQANAADLRAIEYAEKAMENYRGSLTSPAAAQLHANFHDRLVRPCGSATLLRIRTSLYEMSQRYRYMAAKGQSAERDVADEHRQIASAVKRRDVDTACALMADHIRRTAKIVQAALEALPSTGAARPIVPQPRLNRRPTVSSKDEFQISSSPLDPS
jgi:GntR family transcriptional regulator, carbon starvation induced regulator